MYVYLTIRSEAKLCLNSRMNSEKRAEWNTVKHRVCQNMKGVLKYALHLAACDPPSDDVSGSKHWGGYVPSTVLYALSEV